MKIQASKIIAFGIMLIDAFTTLFVLYLCYLSVKNSFTGSLPYLTALIGALQACTAVVLNAYFKMATADHQEGGITYAIAKAANYSNNENESI